MRFRFDVDRNRFIAGRGLLRSILSQYLNTKPGGLEFVYGANGKPSLSDKTADPGIRFNLAHSENLALMAVVRGRDLGVDVERIRPIPDVEQLVARFFSPGENAAFRALPEDQRLVAFFNLWTRKEAWLKATGEGISQSLRLVEVSFLPGEPARLINIEGIQDEAARWHLLDLKPAVDFAAALACRSGETEVNCWRWPGHLKGMR
jgi:4'-phosphopantetheinyl transferase